MKRLILVLLTTLPISVCGQFGVNFHQSNLPFVGLNYEIKNRLRPEIRVGVDNYIEYLNVEIITSYDFLEKEEYEVYAGLGVGTSETIGGIVIPVGVNFYPFTTKNFGFHIEVTPLLGENNILRGSWGIRYRFRKPNTKGKQ